MDYMFETGFLGTRAPFFMDFVMIMVAVLPLLVLIAISFAKKKNYRLHGMTQSIIYVVAVIVVGYFEYGVRAGGGYEGFVEGSSVSHQYAFYVLIFHIVVAVIGFSIWTYTLITARKAMKNNTLVGSASASHKKAGIRAFIWIILTAITGIWVYVLLFMV
jgi:putative membrane protein